MNSNFYIPKPKTPFLKPKDCICYYFSQTEKFYLQAIEKEIGGIRVQAPNEKKSSGDGSWKEILKKIQSDFEEDDRWSYFILCDYDTPEMESFVKALESFIKEKNAKEKIIIVKFTPAIEVWFLMHFDEIQQINKRQIVEKLSERWVDNFKTEYNKKVIKNETEARLNFEKLIKNHLNFALQQAEKDTKRKFVENILEFFDKIDTLKKSTNS
jgi:hypothetical protein